MTAARDQFDAKSARTRQPLPLWAGAFDRATKEQGPEVIGAYMLILMAMWEAKSCDLPDDEKHLAWVAKVSPTIWRRKYAPIITPMLSVKNSRIFSEKLKENAEKTEEYCRKQYERKAGKFEPKPLKNNNEGSTADEPGINRGSTGDEPKQLTINIGKKEGTNVPFVIPQKSLIDKCLDHFNATAETVGWPKVQTMSAPRRAALTQRVKDCGGGVAWREAIDRAAKSQHLTGQNDRGWRASFDWLCKPANFTKLMEGNYDPPPVPPAHPKPTNGVKNERLAFDKALNAAIKAAPPGASLVDRSRSDPFAKR